MKRVFVLGLDGMAWHILRRRFERGEMPYLESLVEEGGWGTLMSVTPPVTAPAWTTFQTGVMPGTHGLLDFTMVKPRGYETTLVNSSTFSEETIWETVSRHGGKVVAVNVPLTWPPRPVEGILVGGMQSPTLDSPFIYPPEQKEELLREVGDYRIITTQHRFAEWGLERFVAELTATVEARFRMGKACLDRVSDWNLGMVHIQSTDVFMHAAYPSVDPTDHRYLEEEEDLVGSFYQKLDKGIKALLEPMVEEDIPIVVMSDHGFGGIDRVAFPNAFLRKRGHQARAGGLMGRLLGGVLGALRKWDKWGLGKRLGKAPRAAANTAGSVTEWGKTKAFHMAGWVGAFIHINKKERAMGKVDPEEEEELRERLIEEFTQWKGRNGRRVVKEVLRGVDIYPNLKKEWAPDLYLVPAEGVEFSSSFIHATEGPVSVDNKRDHVGSHRPEGIYIALGRGAKRGEGGDYGLVDLMPTLLSLLEIPVGEHLEGSIMDDLFPELTMKGKERETGGGKGDTGGGDDDEIMAQRLRDLGYL